MLASFVGLFILKSMLSVKTWPHAPHRNLSHLASIQVGSVRLYLILDEFQLIELLHLYLLETIFVCCLKKKKKKKKSKYLSMIASSLYCF